MCNAISDVYDNLTGHTAREAKKEQRRQQRQMEQRRQEALASDQRRARNMANSQLNVDNSKNAQEDNRKKKRGTRLKKALGKKLFEIPLNNTSSLGGVSKTGLGVPKRKGE